MCQKSQLNSIPARTPAPERTSSVWYVHIDMWILLCERTRQLTTINEELRQEIADRQQVERQPKSRRRGWLTLTACYGWNNWLRQWPRSQPPLTAVVTTGILQFANSILNAAEC